MVKLYEAGLSRGTLEVQELFERLTAIDAPVYSEEYIDRCAVYLSELNNCRELVWQHLSRCQRAEDWLRTFYAPQTFLLGQTDLFVLRANIWVPPKAQAGFADQQKELYAYEVAHNHDFRFLTVGFHGPGYETDLYEVDPDALDSTVGQPVVLENHRKERLGPGKILYFEPYRDVHVQHEPTELSISINLIFRRDQPPRDQLLFDVARSVSLGPPALAAMSRFTNLVGMSALFATPELERTLERISVEHSNARVKESARQALEGRRSGAGSKR